MTNMESSMERLSELSKKHSSGKKISRPSDDPAIAVDGLSARSGIRNAENYINLSSSTANWLDANDIAVEQMIEELTRALVLTESGISDTIGEDERSTLAGEMTSILDGVIEIANTRHEGNYLFSGYLTQTKPFALVTGSPDTVSYSGDAGTIERAISPGQTVTVSLDGNTAFTPAFDAIIRARDGLANNDTSEISAAISDIQDALETAKTVRTDNGARRRQVNNVMDRLEETRLDLETLLSQKEDVNMAEVISDLQYQEVVYQSVLESGKMALNLPNMFNFLA